MSQSNVITGSDSTPIYRVRKIGPADLKDALAKGLADFSAKPSHLVFFGSHLSSRRDRACCRRVSTVDLPASIGVRPHWPICGHWLV
jgi:hypothetical protein